MKQTVQFTIRPILWIALVTFSVQVWGLDCSSSNIFLTTQAEVDNFQATYGGGGTCDRVTAALGVGGNDITNVDSLIALTSLGTLFLESNPNLTNVNGLANLTSVQRLSISNNAALTDIDAFSNLTSVGEQLEISGNSSLSNLDGLISLTSVGGYLTVLFNQVLTDIDGLANLASVGGVLTINENPLLTDIDGLNALTSVQGKLILENNASLANLDGLLGLNGGVVGVEVLNNASLTNISGLSNITSVVEELIIRRNHALINLNGLSNITSVGSLDIADNAALTNLDGLSSLTNVQGLNIGIHPALIDLNGLSNVVSVGHALSIYDNDALTNLDALSNITSIGFHLAIQGNAALTSLNGLSNITSVSYLQIGNNAALTNLDGLSNITSVGEVFHILNNISLSDCSALAALLGWPNGPPDDLVLGEIEILNNATGCNSIEEILASVSGPTAPFITASEAAFGQAFLTFSSSSTTDALWPITGYQAQCLSDNQFGFQNATILGIPDLGSVVSPLIVSNVPFSNAAGLSIPVNITHPRTRHLTVTLKSPSGTSVLLWDEAVGTGTDLVGTFPTTLTPAESLDAFNGLNFNGEWQLTVADGVASHIGTLNSWGLTIMGKVTAISTDSPIVLTGLADSQPYSCDVSAITGLGIGPASNTVSVTPTPELIFDNGFEE